MLSCLVILGATRAEPGDFGCQACDIGDFGCQACDIAILDTNDANDVLIDMMRMILRGAFVVLTSMGPGLPVMQSGGVSADLSKDRIAGHRILKTHGISDKSARDRYARVIYEDRSSAIWIGTDTGMMRYDESLDSWKTIALDEKKYLSVTVINQSLDNKVWFLHRRGALFPGSGLGCFDGEHWCKTNGGTYRVQSDRNVPDQTVYALFEGIDGVLWIAKEDGLISYDGQQWSNPIRLSEMIGESRPVRVRAGYQEKNGDIWLGRASNGIIQFDKARKVWIKHCPMQKKDSPHEENLNVFREIAGSEVNCIYEDRKARLWVATGDGRVYMFDKDKVHWTSYNLFERIPKGKKKTSARLPSLRIFTMYQDQSGLMMFGTELGFVVLSEADNARRIFNADNSALPVDRVYSIMEDRLGRIWLGSKCIVVLEP